MSKTKKLVFLHLLVVILLLRSLTLMKASETFLLSKDDDRIVSLPGQPSNLSVSQFSGYVTVNQINGRALFYWFFEALSNPSDKPLVLWLNGGPGCSSIGYGALVELGPLKIDENGVGLVFNNYSWISEANLLFVESPVGVGFSYTNTSSELTKLDDKFVAEDAYNFLVNWLARYPQFKNRDFFLAGESYAGHYVPQLAELIYDRNKDETKSTKINLKGFLVGNPETDDYYDSKGLLEYAWSHSVISDDLFNKTSQVCDFKTLIWSNECLSSMNLVFSKYKEIDIYNIYAPICLSNTTLSPQPYYYFGNKEHHGLKRARIFSGGGGYDPCYSKYAEKYINREDVQASLHANTNTGNSNMSIKWDVCNGDVDGRVPVIGTRYCVQALGLPIKTPWRSWYHQHQVGGRLVEYEGLTLVTIRGAGHLVPLNKPSEALGLFHSFLTGEDLPFQR